MQSPFRDTCLAGRVALITGGGSGIGLEIAMQIGLHGGKVAIMGRREKFLDNACKLLSKAGVDASYVRGDVRSSDSAEEAIATVLARHGKMDTLVNSAAGNFLAAAEQLKTKGFKTVMEIDAVGVFNMSRAAHEALKESGRGVIINISATLHYGASWYQVHAAAAKAAIDSVTRTLALEWGTYNIRVNGIAPGPIADTAGMTKLAPGADQRMMEEMIGAHVPLGRMGTKWDVAMAAVFLCCEGATYVTGDTIVVDGAAWMYTPPQIPREMVLEMSKSVEKKSRDVVGKPQSRL